PGQHCDAILKSRSLRSAEYNRATIRKILAESTKSLEVATANLDGRLDFYQQGLFARSFDDQIHFDIVLGAQIGEPIIRAAVIVLAYDLLDDKMLEHSAKGAGLRSERHVQRVFNGP